MSGAGNDTIVAGTGNDSLLGGRDDDTFVLAGNLTSDDTISGGDTGTNSDTLTFTDANGAADDLNNVTGIETIRLGNTTTNVVVTTVDTLVANGATLTVNGSSLTTGTMTWYGAAESDGKFSITGGALADSLVGGGGNDTIVADSGADTINAGAGVDSINAGSGHDVLVFASASELAADVTVIGESGTDTIRMDTGSTALTLGDADFADVIQVENLDLTGTAAQTVTLGAQTNEAFASGITITTNATAASLNLQGSASTVFINATGTNNADTLVGGSANDTLDAGSGGGSVSGGVGADTIYWSGTGNTTIVGGDGDDFVDPAMGQTGADSIDGGAGNDTIYGGGGNDTILGGIGNDHLIGEDGSNVLWGGQGADTISANNGAIDTVIMVGDLSTADATKLADVNATLDALMGYNYPDVGTGYVSDVDPSDAIAFDTTSGITDVLYTFGTVDLSGLNIQGSYSIVAHSKITLTESQINAATSITFVGASSHEIVVVNNDRSAIEGTDQQVIVETWADQAGQQLKFLQGNAGAAATGMSVGGNNYVAVPKPVSKMLIDEKFETPVRSGVDAGSPFATSEGVQNLRWDNANGGGTIASFAVSGDEFITSPGFRASNRVEINDRFAGANFVTYFEPGYTQLPIPSTFESYGDDAVHREQFEVFNGSYDIRTGVFTVQRSPYFGESTRTEYTLIIYDDDPATTVGDVEGIVFANQLLERSGWSTVSPRTANAKVQYGNTVLDNSGSYNYIYGTPGNDGALTTTGDIDYIYALDGNDYLNGGTDDFLFAGTGMDTVVSGIGENLIDLGYTLATWSTGDDAQDIVIVGAGTSQLAGANAYGHLTGQDYVYNFEFDLDILRVVKTGVSNFSHAVNTTFGGASTTSGQTAAAFSGTTLTVDLDANGTLGSGDVVVTFDQYHATIGTGRVQYDLLGTSGNDVIVGGSLNDTIRGDDGDDTLTGGAGADSLSGGNGNDLLLFATVSDVLGDLTIRGDSGTDTIRIASQITTAVNLGTQSSITSVEKLELVGGSTAYVTPDTSTAQILLGAAGLVQLSATGQAVTGSAGNDTIMVITGVSSSSDLMGGTNTVVVTDGANISAATFTATGGAVGYDLDLARTTTMTIAQNALITSGGGFNMVTLSNAGIATGFSGVEAYVLANGANTFTMVAGNKTVTGGTGDDIVEGSSMADSITLGSGDDIVAISAATDAAFETFDGGDHVNGDTIRVTGSGNVDLSNDSITAFEKMDLGTDTGAQSVTISISQRIALSDISAIAQDVVTVKGVFDNSLDYTALAQGNATIILDDSDNSVTIDVTDADNMRTGGAKFASNDTITIAATEAVLASVFATPANYGSTALGGAAIVLNDSVDNTITINTDQFSALSAQGIKFAATEDIILTGVYGTATDWSLWTTTQIGGNSVTLDDSDDLTSIDESDLFLMDTYQQTFVDADVVTLFTGSTTDISSILWIDNLTATFNNIDLTGNSGANILTGNGGINGLDGGIGNDTLIGGVGNDSLSGGDGNDVFIVNGTADISAGEVYDGGADFDTLSVTATTDFTGVASITLIETISLDAGVGATFDAADLSGQTLAIDGSGNDGGESLIFNGTSSGEVIDLGGLTVDVDDISGVVINAGDGNDTIIGTNGVDTILGGAGADVFKYTDTGDTTTDNTISQMDVIEGFNITEDSFDLSSLGAVSGLTATVDPSDADSYVISWTSGGVTNYVYVKDTGVTGGLTLNDNGSGAVTATATAAPALGISLISVSSTGITTQGDGPHRAYFTQGDTVPIRNDSTTYFTQSSNVGASTDYTFALADIDASDATVRVGHVAIQGTNTGVNTYLDAHVYIGGATDTNDTIVADISGGLTTLNFAIVYAQGGNDTITGSTGSDYIFGGAGNDSIVSAGGADVLDGGDGNDVFVFTDNVELRAVTTVIGGVGTDVIKFTSAVDTLSSGSAQGNNFDADFTKVSSVEVIELSGASKINLGDVFKTSGLTTIVTGNDDTTVRYDSSLSPNLITIDAVNLADGKTLTLTENAGISNFAVTNLKGDLNASLLADAVSATVASGTGFAVSIAGGSGNDTLTGGAGSDTITGGAGTDSMVGGAGADVFAYSANDIGGGDVIADFASSDDQIFVELTGSVLDASVFTAVNGVGGVDWTAFKAGNILVDTWAGQPYDDVFVFVQDSTGGFAEASSTDAVRFRDTANNALSAANFDFKLTGTAGNDVLTGGAGDDVIIGLGGNDTLKGGLGADSIYGDGGSDLIIIETIADLVAGDLIDAGRGDLDKLRLDEAGTYGADVLDADISGIEYLVINEDAAGWDITFVGLGGTNSGNTIRFSSQVAMTNGVKITAAPTHVNHELIVNATNLAGDDTITGGIGNDILNGGGGDDVVSGSSGLDTIDGGSGNDVIDGGLGNDRLTGGAGSDVFRFSSFGNGLDTITDFVTADGDVLDFSSITDQHDVYNSGTAVVEGSSGEITLAAVNGRFVYFSVADITTADISEASLFGSGQEFAAEGTPSPLDFVLAVGETTGTDGVKIYQVFDGADPDDKTISQIGFLSGVSLGDVGTKSLDLGTAPIVRSTFTVDYSTGDQIVTGSPAFGTASGYQNITNFDTSAGDRIEISNLSLSAGRSFDGTSASISVVNTDSSWGAAGGPLVDGSAISSSAVILKATGTALGMDNLDPTLAKSLGPPLDYAFDLTSLLDQESLIVIIEADDLDNDPSTTQSWLALHRNEGANDDATGTADFQYLALISYASTDVLDQTSFIFT